MQSLEALLRSGLSLSNIVDRAVSHCPEATVCFLPEAGCRYGVTFRHLESLADKQS